MNVSWKEKWCCSENVLPSVGVDVFCKQAFVAILTLCKIQTEYRHYNNVICSLLVFKFVKNSNDNFVYVSLSVLFSYNFTYV